MVQFDQTAVRQIQEAYEELTAVEKSIADFFIENKEQVDFSSKSIAGRLYVSEASLSRFAKKCGYKGFREFIYNYEKSFQNEQGVNIDELTRKVVTSYQELLEKNTNLVDEQQMHRIAKLLSECDKAYVYGMGSSGYAAHECKLRLMRVGLNVEAVSDSHMIKMTSALAASGTLIFAFSLSGRTREIITAVRIAKERGAKVVLVTAAGETELGELCDEVLRVATIKNLEIGLDISPQFPILVMVDIFFLYYLNTDFYYKSAKHTDTLDALYRGAERQLIERDEPF